jgi:hypothetical protein
MNKELIEMLLKVALGQEKQEKQAEQIVPEQQIVVLDKGFVYVGNVTIRDGWVNIENARNIRIWGTTKGLGELRNGPLKETKLDECGIVLAPLKSLIHLIPCKGF